MVFKRRRFIKHVSVSTFLLSILGPFKGLFGDTIEPPKWIDLLEIAKWCPTVHNLQPHKIKIISSVEAHLYYNPKRLLPVGDPDSVFATVAMGVFIEHLSIVAGDYGYRVVIDKVFDDITVDKKEDTLFAVLRLEESIYKEKIDSSLIKKRRTSRNNYNGVQLSDDIFNAINIEANNYKNQFFHTNDEESINYIKQINQEALFEDLDNQPIRTELDGLFRYNKKDAERKKDGLWAKCMGFAGALLKSVFQEHNKWTNGLGKILLKETYLSSFKGTPTICWFRGPFHNKYDYLDNGRMFARCWLMITGVDAYIHPFESLITNKLANKKLHKKFIQSEKGEDIWMIFRVGYSKTPARSYRLDTNDFLIT